MNSHELFNLADALEKVAEYIQELETENESLEKTASAAPVSVNKAKEELHHKLASIGFTDEEIEAMDQMPDTVMTKVATITEQPWSLGEPSGMKREKTDPFLEFLVNAE
jgi:predicted  nucleic acid-binding Zn-ribbon protein